MARAIIRPLPIYVNGKKIAECTSGSYQVASGDEAQVGTDGYLGHSDGATMTKVDAKTVMPVKGMQVNLTALLKAKSYVTMGIPVGGQFHQIDMRIVTANIEWESKSGACSGSFSFEGGDPELVG